MSTLTQFLGGNRPATLIPSGTSNNGIASTVSDDPGALTANVWKEVLNVSGAGVLHVAAIRHAGATSQQVGIRAIIDGVTAATIDEASASTNSAAGAFVGSDNGVFSGGTAIH